MIYGLYLSATGVLTNIHRQDVIANNLANSETVGFKRDLPLFQERLTEAQERRLPTASSELLERIGGGVLISPTALDLRQGDADRTGNALDLTLRGSGFFSVSAGGEKRLTRDGQFMLDREGYLVMSNEAGNRVLDPRGRPIQLDPRQEILVDEQGQIHQGDGIVARLGMFDVNDPAQLRKQGGGLFSSGGAALRPSNATVASGFVERSNVDPTVELAALMQAQRELEANANMIRTQDQTLAKLVNEVGRIG